MSEYQYYEFLAVDRPLAADEMTRLRSLSSRARITSTSLVVSYNYGDFRGDPRQLVERHFDAFLYMANWGTRQLLIRLPRTLLAAETVQQYCVDETAVTWSSGEHVVLDYTCEEEPGGYWEEAGEGWLASIIPAREDLARGDLRLLYLGWLFAVQSEAVADEEHEPPVPPGLRELTGSLQRFVEFLGLDEDLVAVAAQASCDRVTREPTAADLATWVSGLLAEDKDTVLLRLMQGGPAHLGTELLRRFHAETTAGAGTAGVDGDASVGRRTASELLSAADALHAHRQRQAEEEAAREQARRERAAAEATARRRADLVAEGDGAWQRVSQLIETKKQAEYDVAVAILTDLHAIGREADGVEAFGTRIAGLRELHARKPSLIARLDSAGLGPALLR
ncbi:MAG: hypothetical protein HY241_09930 [Actinobacteria bacterium]|nr:hypothetical protein [Actinomycetota bacterium]